MGLWYNKNMHKRGSRKGFTLVELSLSIAFISVLSLAVVLIIMNAISAYHRGLILNQINTTGMELVDDMRAAIQSSPARNIASECAVRYTDETAANNCNIGGAAKFVSQARYTTVKLNGNNVGNVPVYGVFCTGEYSYLWNAGYFFSTDNYEMVGINKVNGTMTLKYRAAGNGAIKTYSEKFRLLKVRDEDRSVCIAAAGANYGTTASDLTNTIDISGDSFGAVEEEPIELLPNQGALALYDLQAPTPALDGTNNNMFYAVSFILGTVQGGVNVGAANDNCVAPEDYDNAGIENFDYCAINKFNFAAQANGG